MYAKRDIVIGSMTNYTFDAIEPWVNSLDRSGFEGVKAMLCYNVDYDTVEELTKRNYTIFAFGKNDQERKFVYKPNFSIVVERFYHMWYFLNKQEEQFRFLITTDVKDVIFQADPTKYLYHNMGKKVINVGSESIRYCDEDWGKNNMVQAFGAAIYDQVKNNTIYNCGTLGGDYKDMLDLFLNIYMLSNSTSHQTQGGGGPDQAALNVLLNMNVYKFSTRFNSSEDGWAAQLGTTGPQIKDKYAQKLLEPSPILCDNVVCTSEGKPFALVHQYDRVPEWKDAILKKYKD